jgi:hypothetical protein
MPENENKTVSQQRQEEMDKGKLKKVAPIDTSSLQTDDLTKAAFNRQQTQNKADETSEAISNAYYSPMQQLGVWASERQEAKKKLQEQDETAQRQASNLKMIAGISDGLASLANLIGVADRGSNIDLGSGALTPLQQKMEAARLERKADIKSIDDRLDQYKNQMLQMQLAKGNAIAAQKAQEAERAYKTSERVAGEQHAEKMLDKKLTAEATTTAAKLQSDAYQKALDRFNAKEVARIRANASEGSKRKPEQFTLTGADGKEVIYTLPAETAEAIMRDFDASIAADLEADGTSGETSSAFRKAYDNYQDISRKRSMNLATDQQVKDARNALIEESPTLRKKIEGYGNKWSNWAM